MEEEEGRAGLRELARFPDVMVVCSSAGWTDQKHMLYLGLLQESFVNRLHDGEISFRGLFDLSPGPGASGPKQPSKVDRAKVEPARTPCCGNQGDGEVHSMDDDDDDDASSTETVQESCSQASATSSGPSSPCHSAKRGRSPSSTAEGSDQNFIDEDTITRETGESRGRRRSIKRLKVC
ncbi:hypothetical protein CFC21_016008 [Triticum aestivum]|uniref:Uncharacterized protein n=3 Tax=Triticum TaxID=4564 RepID=A0A9R1NN37_TRITD|nr:uncharacterized protein LOC119353778 [Triticum dicoccoides]XP_044455871.1 uncharacterized protein LOC123187934 isoform X1 [Triticum aestivum]KAF7000056.1 hypothetical protein CFC21_016008 [Triticum aestivum]VAH27939.1 unnamed protein product [Triticum turgidum subsp. durum]